MDITGNVWQQAAGDTDRHYAHLCLEWDVILNGPGYGEPWPDCEESLRAQGRARKATDIRRFADEVQEGDLVVLRVGTNAVYGVGQVVGSYEWSDEFGDVDGWDLEHVRRVRWFWRAGDDPRLFDKYSLKWGDTTQRLDNEVVKSWVAGLDIPDEGVNTPLKPLPSGGEKSNPATIEQVSEFLFDKGVASASIRALVDEIDELVRIAKWYQRATSKPSEHETVAYLVVPLLRALGWTPQRMAVEWNRIDVALFDRLPRAEESLMVVVEAKKMGRSCLQAVSQAESYACKRSQCRRLLVSDGVRYGVFTRGGTEEFKLHAYLNIDRLRDRYPIYHCEGAGQALLAMAPEWETETKV